MIDAQEQVDRLIQAGMKKEKAEEAVAAIIESGLGVEGMVDLLIAKINPKSTIVEADRGRDSN